MSYAALKNTARRLSDQAGFLVEITNSDEYEQALELMDDYDNQQVLIELLSTSIERWNQISASSHTFMFSG